jgi:hypothetical protein
LLIATNPQSAPILPAEIGKKVFSFEFELIGQIGTANSGITQRALLRLANVVPLFGAGSPSRSFFNGRCANY